MKPDDTLISVPTFPRLGGQPFGSSTVPDYPEHGPVHRSQCVSDETVGPHARAILATLNLRKRREGKVQLNAPVFRDEHTPWPFQDPTINYEIDKYEPHKSQPVHTVGSPGAALTHASLFRYPEDHDVRDGSIKLNHIYMDNPSFAFGSAALQITMQTKNIEDARYLYDQLIPLGPVMLALTAGTPAYKGFLAATDARWNITCAGVDDRSPEERGDRVGSPLPTAFRRRLVTLTSNSLSKVITAGSPSHASAPTPLTYPRAHACAPSTTIPNCSPTHASRRSSWLVAWTT